MPVAIRRRWFAAQLIVAAVVAVPIRAQSSVSASLTATVTVVAPLSLTVTHALDFGRVLTYSAKTVTPIASTAGHFEVAGQGGSTLTVTLLMPKELTPAVGSTNLPVTGWEYLSGETPVLSGAPISFNGGALLSIPTAFPGLTSSKLYFGIGATVQVPALQPTGSYSGTGQITANYTDL
ncbi:MAG TPA: DUF4402 domain-containing protein [Gemmatimonadaceae bacterium]